MTPYCFWFIIKFGRGEKIKITFKTLDGRTLNKEFIDANDFVRQQNLEIPAIDDSAKVVEVIIDEKPYEFVGNIADLYFKLSK